MTRFTNSTRRFSVLALLALAGAFAALPAAAVRYARGQQVEVTGIVTGPDGAPMRDLRAVLELQRVTFSLRSFQRAVRDTRRVAAVTDEKGQFTLSFPWDSYYNQFELVVGVPVRKPGGERIEVLERVDLTPRVEKGSPVVATVVVANAAFVAKLRQFVAQVQSEDEQRVYAEMGKPDEVQVVNYPDRREASWWFFDSGKVYRFRDGKLTEITPFDPVRN
ncbi:MAG: hypothetical protein ACRD2T_05985 [Thermoanaerobaculia bacterium]